MGKRKIKIAAVGDNCIDVYMNLNETYVGGNPVNVAVYLVRLGEHASYTGVVGNDKYGTMVMDALRKKGVDISHVRVVPGNTAVTKVELINGERVFGDYTEGVLTDFKLTDDDIDFLCGHELVITGIWGNMENELYKMKDRGIPVAFDFSTEYENTLVDRAAPYVDYAFFAFDEADSPKVRDYLKKIYNKGPRLVIATLGEKGSIAYDGKDYRTFGIVKCDVKDTMGAGDSYIAGFLRGILLGKEVTECMKLGAENSSITLQYYGAW